MNFFLVLVIALALAMDAFAVSVGLILSLERITKLQTFRLAFCFGFFQFLMPLIGWSAGRNILNYIQAFDHWVAFGLLSFIGSKMILESFKRTRILPERGADGRDLDSPHQRGEGAQDLQFPAAGLTGAHVFFHHGPFVYRQFIVEVCLDPPHCLFAFHGVRSFIVCS